MFRKTFVLWSQVSLHYYVLLHTKHRECSVRVRRPPPSTGQATVIRRLLTQECEQYYPYGIRRYLSTKFARVRHRGGSVQDRQSEGLAVKHFCGLFHKTIDIAIGYRMRYLQVDTLHKPLRANDAQYVDQSRTFDNSSCTI